MKYTKRMLAFLLAVCMVFTSVQLPVNAEEDSAIETVAEDLTVEESVAEESEVVDDAVAEDSTEEEITTDNSEAEELEEVVVEEETSEDADASEETVEEIIAVEEEVVSYAVASASETDKDVVDAAIFFSDLHSMKNGDSTEGSEGYKKDVVTDMMTALKNTGLNFSSVTSVGDAFSSNETAYTGKTSVITGYIRNALDNQDIPVNYTWSDHDRAALAANDKDLLENKSGLIYGAGKDGIYGNEDDGNYYIYAISMSDTSSSERYSQPSTFTTQKLQDFKDAVEDLDNTKPLFVASHQPLLARRSDNQYAYQWCTAINEIAEKRDVAFFFGHNHKYDQSGDYYYEKGATMSVQDGSSTKPVELNFTHMCAGYFNPSTTGSAGSSRQGTVMLVTIYDDEINYTTYCATGEYKGNNAVNETVDRDHIVKTVTYEDNILTIKAASSGLTAINAENVTGEYGLNDYFTDHIAYNVELTGHKEDEKIDYSILFLDDMDDTNVELYHVDDAENMIPISYKMVTDEYGRRYIEFTTTYTGNFVYGVSGVPEGYELSKIEVSNVVKDTYFVGENLDMVNPKVTATYTKEGSEDIVRKLFIQGENVSDGYTVSGYDMTQPGNQTVVISYQDKTISFEITVKERGITDTATGIKVVDADNKITALSVTQREETVEGYSVYVVYDINPEGYVQGTEAEVTIPVRVTKFDIERPVQIIDVELGIIQNGYIEDGKVTFTATHFSEYAVAQRAARAAATASGDVATGVSNNNASSSIRTAGYYLIQNNNHKGYLTGNLTNGNSMLALEKTNNNAQIIGEDNVWYIVPVSGGYTVQYGGPNGEYLTFGAGTGGLNKNSVIISLSRPNNSANRWQIGLNDQYLNNYGGTRQNQAAGYSTGAGRDEGSRWNLYKVTTTTATLSINESALGMHVDETINLTASVMVGNDTVTGSTITWESSNTNVVTVDASGRVVAKGVGTAEITAILTSVSKGTLLEPVRVTIPVQVNVLFEGTIIDITHKSTQQTVDRTLVVKNVKENDAYELDYEVLVDGIKPESKPTSNITWTSSDEEIATVEDGVVTFHGKEGVVRITVAYKYDTENNENATDTVVISVSAGNYMLPTDGTNDFPEYPNEGSVRFDKTATAVGDFSETGIAQLELSMTGVPFTSDNVLDVVLMLDHSNSMTEDRMDATREATKLFVKNIVTNEDGSFNKNRIFIGSFQGGNPKYAGQTIHEFKINEMTSNEQKGYQIVDSQSELDALLAKIETVYQKYTTNPPYGTEYAQSLERCYKLLRDTKDDGHKQACVFMSDGIPNVYQYGPNADDQTTSSDAMAEMFSGTNYNTRGDNYKYEYYSTQMKLAGVTVYTVGLGLYGTNSALGNASKEQCENAASILLNDISGPAGETTNDTETALSKKGEYFYSVADTGAAAGMADVFDSISRKILDAAKDVKVTDKIADKYTMIFDFPNSEVADEVGGTQEFYIEVKDYKLVPTYGTGTDSDVIVDYTRGTASSLMKLYIGKNKDGSGNVTSYYAASDANGSRYKAVKFATTPIGKQYYWTTDSTKNNSGVSIESDGVTYYFVLEGNGTHNITEGAFASGTPTITDIISDESKEIIGTNTTCQDMIIATPYFVYNAATRMLVWTIEKLGVSEITLSYFLYLEKSGGYVGAVGETLEGTYYTNDYATLEYTNFQDNNCQQIFPRPQMSWNGAQVSYVFYLVNKDGKPVNRAGRVIPFSEAVYVTDTFTYAVVWNRNDASAELEVEYLAKEKVPSVYQLYDIYAGYNIYVYETENGTDKNNHFEIIGSSKETNTTYVFNTKSDGIKYKDPGTYTATGKNSTNKVHAGFDFSNTTVAFAVLWKPELIEDTVVIDYGLPVDIDVARNDAVLGKVTGVFGSNNAAVLEDVTMNSGQLSNRLFFPMELNPDGTTGIKYGKAEVISDTAIRYTPVNMQMKEADIFYYVTTLNYWEKDSHGRETLVDSRMYSSVTVIPATTIYYEDCFVSYEHGYGASDKSPTGTPGKWEVVGNVNTSATQDEDRPGKSKIAADLDADNIYGYDSAYVNCDTYSLGSAYKVNLNKKPSGTNWPSATFTFTGTGFDIISQTSNTTGTIAVTVTGDALETPYNWIVDTYYGYTAKSNGFIEYTFTFGDDGIWHLTNRKGVEAAGKNGIKKDSPERGDTVVVYEENIEWTKTTGENALYQIPIIKSPELTYGTYTVTITPRFSTAFNHTANDNYDFYLDAIRIYSPANDGIVQTGNGSVDKTVYDAYKADGELYPEFIELRKELLEEKVFATEASSKTGAVFIDGFGTGGTFSQYQKYGPNNEIYLQNGQAVAFILETDNYSLVNREHIGIKSPNGGDASVKVSALAVADGTQKTSKDITTSSASEQYFDISDCVSWTPTGTGDKGNSDIIVIENTGSAMVSLTNLKVTYKVASAAPALLMMNAGAAARAVSYMNARYMNSFETVGKAEVLSVTTDRSAYTVSETINVSIKTNDAAEYVIVNGEKIADYTAEGDFRIWTYSATASENEQDEFAVVAYNKLDEVSEVVSKTVDIKMFAPETFKLELNKSKIVAGEKVKAKVTTSKNVKYVIVNGKKITKYTTDKAKTLKYWTYEVKVTKIGTELFEVVAYDAKGNDSVSITESVESIRFAPETFELELNKSKMIVGDKVKAKATTSKNVKYVTVNGKKITKYTTNKAKTLKYWTYEVKVTQAGIKDFETIAYNSNGSASESISKSVEAIKFEPETFDLALNKDDVIVGEKVKAKVTTSKNVKYVTVNGKKITKYTTDKAKTLKYWTYEAKAAKVGTMTFEAIAYNANGGASESVLKSIEAARFAPETFELELNQSKVVIGEKVKAKVTTSSTVKYVTVNGKKITKYTTDEAKTLKYWTYETKMSKVETKIFKAVAYNTNGSASESISKSVEVTKFEPETFELTVNEMTVNKGSKYIVTVTASDDVKYVKVNGKKITKFTYDDEQSLKVFNVTYTATSVGKKNVKAVVYNKNGVASNGKTVIVTVQNK